MAELRLSEDQRATFERDGYISVPALTSPDEVEQMRAIYDRLFATKAGWSDGNLFDFAGDEADGKVTLPQMLWPSKYAPELHKTKAFANALAIAKALLGEKAEIVFEHAINKPPLVGPPTPWHQDEAFFNSNTDYESLTIWMPLQPATVENGCMRFVPGSQNGPLVEHQSIGNDPKVHGLEAVGIDENTAVHAPVPTGGATVHGYRTLHAAGPNTSTDFRRAYAIGFGVRGRRTPQPEFHWNLNKQTARSLRAASAPKKRTVRGMAVAMKRRLKRLTGIGGTAALALATTGV